MVNTGRRQIFFWSSLLSSLMALQLGWGSLAFAQVSTKTTAKKPQKASKNAAMAETNSTPNIPPAKKIRLSQKDAAELVLKQGTTTKEIDLQYLQNRLAPALALSLYDWRLILESGWQQDRSDSFSPFKDPNSKYTSYITTATVQKPLVTGTLLGVELSHFSQKADLPPSTNPLATPVPSDQTQNSVGITLEQAIFGNFFGVADRATVNAANETYDANEIQRANALEDTVMSTITLYWDTYVAQENFKEALASRDRYTKLVETVRRKTSLGYSNPGELSQAEAGLQAKEQAVKSTSVDYLMKQENLITTLGLENGAEIDFVVSDTIPTVPKLPAIETENLRNVRTQKLRVEAAKDLYTAAKSNSYPYVALVGRAYTTGSDESSQTAYAETASGTHPKYYVGVKVSYNFGSGYLTENVFNKTITRDLEEARLYRERLEAKDQEAQAERKVQSTYAIALSATKERGFRDKAVQELNRTYSQGRTDIKTFIDALNDFFTAEVALSRAVGDYQISLNQWASVRDELIPDQNQQERK